METWKQAKKDGKTKKKKIKGLVLMFIYWVKANVKLLLKSYNIDGVMTILHYLYLLNVTVFLTWNLTQMQKKYINFNHCFPACVQWVHNDVNHKTDCHLSQRKELQKGLWWYRHMQWALVHILQLLLELWILVRNTRVSNWFPEEAATVAAQLDNLCIFFTQTKWPEDHGILLKLSLCIAVYKCHIWTPN